jgi:hypothetical protein
MHDVQWSAITVTIKILEKNQQYRYDLKNLEQKIREWYDDIFIMDTVILIPSMNQWHHFQISYSFKNQNVMQELATCD